MMQAVDRAVLTLARFPWLCAAELSLFIFFPSLLKPASRQVQIVRTLSALEKSGLMLPMRLNGRSIAYALTKKGRDRAYDLGLEWVHPGGAPGSDWIHDRYVSCILALLSRGDPTAYRTEYEIVAAEGAVGGRPDGLLRFGEKWCLLEIENARKTGANMRRQVERIEMAISMGDLIGGEWVKCAIVAYPILTGINHRTRVINALHQSALPALPATKNLVLTGFEVLPKNPSSIRLLREREGKSSVALNIEYGLPPPVPTGQAIGRRIQYSRGNIELSQPDPSLASATFCLKNAFISIEANEQDEASEVEIWLGGDLIARVQIEAGNRELAAEGVLRYLNKLPRDAAGDFVPPQSVSHSVIRRVICST